MINLACGLAAEWIEEKLNPAETRPELPASSGCALGDGDEIIVGKTFLRFHIVK